MNAEEFVKNWKVEKEKALEFYLNDSEETQVGELIKQLALSDNQKEILKSMLNSLLTDTYYSLLLGLDGSGSIGGLQHTYKIYDEAGNPISDCGEIEAEAWEQFQEK